MRSTERVSWVDGMCRRPVAAPDSERSDCFHSGVALGALVELQQFGPRCCHVARHQKPPGKHAYRVGQNRGLSSREYARRMFEELSKLWGT